MSQQTLEGHVGTEVQIDLCAGCQVIWFDHFESLRLSPGGTLRLFQTIGSSTASRGRPLGELLTCPRCEIRLVLTNDRQRNTPFRYWRCVRNHGKLITFFDFLREKDFIRPLSPAQVDQLRQNRVGQTQIREKPDTARRLRSQQQSVQLVENALSTDLPQQIG